MKLTLKSHIDNEIVHLTGVSEQNYHFDDHILQKLKEEYTLRAIDLLQNKKLSEFDPLVGDTACQIRAVKIATLYSKLSKNGVLSLIKEDQEFLMLSLLLTTCKNMHRNDPRHNTSAKLDCKKLNLELSNRKVNKFLLESQRRLAELSVQFLQELSFQKNNEELIKALQYVCIDDEATFKRQHCAAYHGMQVLLDHMLDQNHAFLVRVKSLDRSNDNSIKIYFKVKNNRFVPVSLEELDPTSPVVIIDGYSERLNDNIQDYMNYFTQFDLKDIMLAFMATHKQFIGKQTVSELPYDSLNLVGLKKEYNHYKEFSNKHGCHNNDKTLFFGVHMYVMVADETINL